MRTQENIGNILFKRTERTPNREILVCGEDRFSYRTLNQRTNQLAHALKGVTVKKGDRVAVLLSNGNEICESLFAMAKIGAVWVPLNVRLAPQELEFIIGDCGAETLIFAERFSEMVEEIRGRSALKNFICLGGKISPGTTSYEDLIAQYPTDEPVITAGNEDNLIIMYTSGTTGRPKGAVLTHHNMYSAAVDGMTGLDYGGMDTIFILLPLFHIGALTPFITAFFKGTKTIITRELELPVVLETIEREKPSTIIAVTAIATMIMQLPDIKKYDFSSVQSIVLLGSPLPFPLVEKAYQELGVNLQNFYGLTEASGPGAHMNMEDMMRKPGSIGYPFLLLDLRIVNERDEDVAVGEVGEIIIRGPAVMKEYWNLPEETKETLRNGWLHTGDMAKVDEEGFIYIVDRKKDVIISGGENIYSAEIEAFLIKHPKILDVAVIGMPDEKWGEVPRAMVELAKDEALTEEELIGFCKGRIAKFKIPKRVDFVQELPRTITGKVFKKELRKQLQKDQ
ncbi:long-chain-fatty-acid--CoA ligase [Thermodesulfobacteriota bacterium]